VTVDPDLRRALELLDKRNVLFAIHAASFPPSPGDDLGVGTPHSEAAGELFEALAHLGYTGVLIGPEGETSPGNPSPYDATWFSRSALLASPRELVRQGLLTESELRVVTVGVGAHGPADPEGARARLSWALDRAWARRAAHAPAPDRFAERHAAWLQPDAVFAALSDVHGPDLDRWPAAHRDAFGLDGTPRGDAFSTLAKTFAARTARHAFAQWIVAEQRRALRGRLARLGLELWGDLQIGASATDAWRFRRLFLRGYALGAPPSRTNPEGQPWGYPIWDPNREDPFADAAVDPRMARFAEDYDGLRIDHPHGWVCPWVYRSDRGDPHAAVRRGARLFESPDEADHPELAAFARVRPGQLHPPPRPPRYADDWVKALTPDQVERHARLLRRLIAPFAPAVGETTPPDARDRIACEVLSTLPHPLARVVEALGLGRFRVTQKADPDDPNDVYRSRDARPEDWVMVGTHDTASIWALADAWVGTERGDREARALAERLRASDEETRTIATDARAFVHAKMADLFASPARNVVIFFADHFGVRERFNTPGTVGPHNWRLRAPSSRASEAGLDLRVVLAGAIRMRWPEPSPEVAALQARLRGTGTEDAAAGPQVG
jgi:4-alpha-glucanotransferase